MRMGAARGGNSSAKTGNARPTTHRQSAAPHEQISIPKARHAPQPGALNLQKAGQCCPVWEPRMESVGSNCRPCCPPLVTNHALFDQGAAGVVRIRGRCSWPYARSWRFGSGRSPDCVHRGLRSRHRCDLSLDGRWRRRRKHRSLRHSCELWRRKLQPHSTRRGRRWSWLLHHRCDDWAPCDGRRLLR